MLGRCSLFPAWSVYKSMSGISCLISLFYLSACLSAPYVTSVWLAHEGEKSVWFAYVGSFFHLILPHCLSTSLSVPYSLLSHLPMSQSQKGDINKKISTYPYVPARPIISASRVHVRVDKGIKMKKKVQQQLSLLSFLLLQAACLPCLPVALSHSYRTKRKNALSTGSPIL